MTPSEQPAGIAFLCDAQGTVLDVIREETQLDRPLEPGRRFLSSIDRDSVQKGLGFLAEINMHGAAFNWVINLPLAEGIIPFHFAGGVSEEKIIVVGARSRSDTIRLYEELMKISNEQVNELRRLMSDQALQARAIVERDGHLYEELSRLNNELSTAQRELARKNAELAKLNELKNQFLGMAAHDLRTPLSVIMSFSQFLIDETEGKLNKEESGFLGTILSSSTFMLNLVNNLLDIAQIETGKLELDLWPVNIGELLTETVARNKVLARKKGIALRLHLDETSASLMLDATKIEQVLNNLIGNAIKFSPAGSSVEIGLANLDGAIEISVRDHGPGIPPEEREKLFRPFQRTSVRSTGGEKGTGLGLAIVKRIVEGHGGSIEVESQVGTGSAFRFRIPITMEGNAGGNHR